jgi:Flp pilus assembly protein TadG
MRKLNLERGSQTLEFTIIGIPLTFLLFSIANMCFSMLTLHTMQEAVEQGARYAATRGNTCSSGGNTCTVQIKDIADVIAKSASGISAGNMKVTFTPPSTGTVVTCTNLSTCTTSCTPSCNGSRTLTWPDGTNNGPPNDITISADCTLNAPMFMFWSGTSAGTKINSTTFHAYSTQRLMF